MHSLWLWLGLGAALLITAMFAFVSAYDRWLDRQSPVGVWIARTPSAKVRLQFEGGPHEGLYKQLTESGDGTPTREFGCWAVERETLRMLILATDVRGHPRFGTDTVYRLTYLSLFIKPMPRIQIDGPDRHKMTFRRAKAGVVVDIGPTPDIGPAPRRAAAEASSDANS